MDDERWLDGWRRQVVIGVGVAAAAVLVGAILGLAFFGRTPGPSKSDTIAKLEPLAPSDLVAAPRARPKKLDDPRGLGSLHAGVALLAVETVDDVSTTEGRRRAPEGSRLIAFKIGDWTCEVQPCEAWRTLAPQVAVDGVPRALPGDGDTFVVVVPPGTDTVDLEVHADGYSQSVSLLDDTPGADNITLLAERGAERRVPMSRTFSVAEHTSIPLDDGAGGSTDTFERSVTVAYAQLDFFLDGTTPSKPSNAFLVVNAYYSVTGRVGSYVFTAGEATFVDENGRRYDARDLDPSPDKGLLGFEVPASVRSGTLVIGGTTDKVTTNGLPYQSTLAEQRVPIDLG